MEMWQFGYWLKEFLLQVSGEMDGDEKCFHFQCMTIKRMPINKMMVIKISSIFLEDTAILLRLLGDCMMSTILFNTFMKS
jgi:hypothetical protein